MGCNALITLGNFDALLFDMDGLLLDTERAFLECLVEMCAPLGLARAAVEPFFLGLVGTSGAQTTAALKAFLPEDVDLAAFDGAWRRAHKERLEAEMVLRPGVAEVIPALRGAGHRMAVVTSTHRRPAEHHLELAGLRDCFELIVAGDEVAANKPDPTPYLTAAASLGVDPTRCAAFEDSDTGTTAAVRAGCDTTQIPDLRPPGKPLPELGQRIAVDLNGALKALGVTLKRRVA